MIRRPRRQEAFTLVELTVALVAGLIVALGIVGLSKDATHTFHEEMRSSAAEANLRSAMDRLRADLARAGYMSTGNVSTDPLIARAPAGPPNPYTNLAGLGRLTSICLNCVPPLAATPLSAVQTIPMNPDAIDIAGNMTSTDQYEVSTIQPGASTCGGARIVLDTLSSSFLRIFAGGGKAELNNIFQPVGGSAGQFIVRFVDKTTRSQFLVTCANQQAIVVQGAQVFLDVAGAVQMAQTTGSGPSGFCTGCLVNPVQIVHWEITPATAEPAQYQAFPAGPLGGQPLTPAVTDPTKYDLVRWYVDAVTGAPVPGTTEVVAEYAVDLKFAFSVEQGSVLQPQIVTFPFDNANSALWAQNILVNPVVGPQDPARIRSVRVRLVTRSAEPDRTFDVPVPNNANPQQPYAYRYCILPGGCDPNNPTGVLQFARARTLTAEVALPNQSRNFYQ